MAAELAIVPVPVELAQVAAELALAVELAQVAAELALELALIQREPVDVLLLLPTVPVVRLVLLFVRTVLGAVDAALVVAAVAAALVLVAVAHRMAVAHSNLVQLELGDTLAVELRAGK